MGRAAAEGFSPTWPRAHWIGPELCRQGEGSALPSGSLNALPSDSWNVLSSP